MVWRPEPKNKAKAILPNKTLLFDIKLKTNFNISGVDILIMEKEYNNEEIVIGIIDT